MNIQNLAKELSDSLKDGRDLREKKPWILFHGKDPSKHINLSSTWLLDIDEHQIHLSQPNDIALYSNIAQRAISRAKAFYAEYLGFYLQHSSGGLIPVVSGDESLFLDYCESVIEGVIFSFTSFEAFANICIPEDYVYEDKNGKSLSKQIPFNT